MLVKKYKLGLILTMVDFKVMDSQSFENSNTGFMDVERLTQLGVGFTVYSANLETERERRKQRERETERVLSGWRGLCSGTALSSTGRKVSGLVPGKENFPNAASSICEWLKLLVKHMDIVS